MNCEYNAGSGKGSVGVEQAEGCSGTEGEAQRDHVMNCDMEGRSRLLMDWGRPERVRPLLVTSRFGARE